MGKAQPFKVVLADDHAIVRAGIRSLMENLGCVEVVGEADNGREAVDLCCQLQPDIVLMDIAMKEMNGLESTLQLKKVAPEVRVIILSMHSGEEYVLRALQAGASGYLLKGSAVEELVEALHTVMNGGVFLSSPISKLVVEDYIKRISTDRRDVDLLSSRQREILQLIAEGKGTKEIAGALFLSVKTVETHRSQLMEKLDIHGVAGLVKFAIRKGLVSLD